MKVLLVNKFYYPRGGDCMVVLNTEQLLRSHSHEVAVFAMQYPRNNSNSWGEKWASEVQFAGLLSTRINALKRTMGWGDIVASYRRVLHEFDPDVVHVHNVHSYLSPVVAKLAHEHGARVVWTMHDYKLMCPAYTCLRNGKPCELCVQGNKWNVVSQRCMKHSLVASAVAWLEALRWNRNALQRHTHTFVCPSQFMARMMCKAGFDENKIAVLPNFANLEPQACTREDYYCYVGRLSSEKGVENLLEVASRLPHHLKVAGSGPLEQELRKRYAQCSNIEFVGQLGQTGVTQLLARARMSTLPSQWYENNPLGVIESLMMGTPVVGTCMGGIAELIDDTSGIVTTSQALGKAIDLAMSQQWDNDAIAQRAQARFAPHQHYKQLIDLYTTA